MFKQADFTIMPIKMFYLALNEYERDIICRLFFKYPYREYSNSKVEQLYKITGVYERNLKCRLTKKGILKRDRHSFLLDDRFKSAFNEYIYGDSLYIKGWESLTEVI